jgi:hypothetical protein
VPVLDTGGIYGDHPHCLARTVNEQFLRYQLPAFPVADEALSCQAEASIHGGGTRPTPHFSRVKAARIVFTVRVQ